MSLDIFTPGKRYPLTAAEAANIMRHGWPAVTGEADLSRGRQFVGGIGEWQFWTTDGRRVDLTIDSHGIVLSQSKCPDPNRPEPLEAAI
jgi:hypothetical protein